ncbi:RNA polymerase sigma factor [Numidum massiliense]|uniref:RNA polymerase sigma factor n=1 Tax=Numidum massiliense TaxID=1522315 RepID=UPI0006D545BD|nr:RNA polymerase sigma factor [Numidum massiliense]
MLADRTLAEQVARGDQAALETLVYRYHAPLHGYLERMLRDRQKAEDVTQEVFVRFIRQARERQVPTQVKAWLYRVATNLCRDYWRSASYRSECFVQEQLPPQVDERSSVVDIFERQELRQEVLTALNILSDTQRTIVILRFYQDMKLQEIADALQIPLGSVKSSLYHAMRYLKKELLKERKADTVDEANMSLSERRKSR